MNLMTPELLEWVRELLETDNIKQFYWSKPWRILRKVRRQVDNNECQRCKRAGRHSPSEMVHHKKEVRYYPELALTLANVECLCNSCHNKEHPEKLGSLRKPRFENEERW